MAPKVLLIDEGRDSHAALERIAGRVTAVVHHARSIADALRYTLRFSYDALLVDWSVVGETGAPFRVSTNEKAVPSAKVPVLPGSGHEVLGGETPLAFLEQLRSTQATAAILLSGHAWHFPDDFRLGGNLLGSFRKPWDDDEIESALRRAFDLSLARRNLRPRSTTTRLLFERVLVIGSAGDARRLERMLRGVVSRAGLLRATSLEQAMVLLGQHTFDVVMTDLCLPDACGLDAILRLRRHSPQTPIVVLTSLDDSVLSDQALQAGAQDVLLRSDLDGQGLLRSLRHARQRQRVQAQLHHGALHDELTSLAKRTLLHQRIANAVARSRRLGNTFALIYIDLDHFKGINDTHGHDVGDAVLVAVSNRLKAAVREYDTVARLGGDEFAILLDTLDDAAEAETVAQRVLSSLSQPVQLADHDVGITASMGISMFPEGGSSPDDLLRSADQAMYCAKRAGRNTYSLTPLVEDEELLAVHGGRNASLLPAPIL